MEYSISFQMYFRVSVSLCFPCVFVFSGFSSRLQNFLEQIREARRFFNQGWERLGCVNQMDEAGHGDLDLHQRRVYSAPRCPLSPS